LDAGGTPPAPALGQKVLGGAVWSVAQTMASKGFALVAQLVLAGLLADIDYALVALTLLVYSLASLGQQIGLGEMLVRQHHRFAREAPATLALAAGAGIVSLMITAAAAPIAARVFAAPGLTGLLYVAALSLPLDASAIVPQSKLRVEMRFRALAILGMVNVLATSVLSVVFAAMQMGAYSLVLPRPIVSLGTCAAAFIVARMPVRIQIRPRIWKRYLRNAGYFVATNTCNTFLGQGDYLIMGLFFPKPLLGAYYFAFNLSTQSLQLIGSNIGMVLLPAFARIDRDRQRQMAAYEKVGRTIMLVGVLGCLMQAALAFPLLRVLFGHKWDAAIPVLQILSLGMIFILASGSGVVMLNAQGRYRLLLIWTAITTVAFLLAVLGGAVSGSIVGIALAVSCFYLVFGPLGVMIPALPGRFGQAIALAARISGKPLLAGVIAAVAGVLAGAEMHAMGVGMMGLYAAAGVAIAAAYLLMLPVVLKQETRDFTSRVKALLLSHRWQRIKEGGA